MSFVFKCIITLFVVIKVSNERPVGFELTEEFNDCFRVCLAKYVSNKTLRRTCITNCKQNPSLNSVKGNGEGTTQESISSSELSGEGKTTENEIGTTQDSTPSESSASETTTIKGEHDKEHGNTEESASGESTTTKDEKDKEPDSTQESTQTSESPSDSSTESSSTETTTTNDQQANEQGATQESTTSSELFSDSTTELSSEGETKETNDEQDQKQGITTTESDKLLKKSFNFYDRFKNYTKDKMNKYNKPNDQDKSQDENQDKKAKNETQPAYFSLDAIKERRKQWKQKVHDYLNSGVVRLSDYVLNNLPDDDDEEDSEEDEERKQEMARNLKDHQSKIKYYGSAIQDNISDKHKTTFKTIAQPDHCGFKTTKDMAKAKLKSGLMGAVGMERVVGGYDAAEHEFPWIVSLQYYKGSSGKESVHFCGGAIIAKNWIITAAHCMDRFVGKEKSLKFKLGVNAPKDKTLQAINATKVYVHPGWDSKTQLNDIALIKVTPDIKFTTGDGGKYTVNAVCLPKEPTEATGSAMLAGWGEEAYKAGTAAEWLQKVAVPFVSRSKCHKQYKDYLGRVAPTSKVEVGNSHVCAGGKGGEDACRGDSGGSLVQAKNRQYFTLGLVSFSVPCAIKDLPTIYTNVVFFMDWISKFVK